MKASRKLNRRSFLASVAGGVAAGGGAVALLTGRAEAQTYTGVTDADLQPVRDRPGYGTGNRSVHTDSDTGPTADAQFHGRGPAGREEGAPSGTGRYGDTPSGCSDSDSGSTADPGGRGRSCNGRIPDTRSTEPRNYRHCTDSDQGMSADPVGEGRNC
jgi:hypothetical protein